MPRRGTPPRRRSLLLGELEVEFSEFFNPSRCRNLHLGVIVLRLGQAIIQVLFFLRLILESVTLLFELPIEDI